MPKLITDMKRVMGLAYSLRFIPMWYRIEPYIGPPAASVIRVERTEDGPDVIGYSLLNPVENDPIFGGTEGFALDYLPWASLLHAAVISDYGLIQTVQAIAKELTFYGSDREGQEAGAALAERLIMEGVS